MTKNISGISAFAYFSFLAPSVIPGSWVSLIQFSFLFWNFIKAIHLGGWLVSGHRYILTSSSWSFPFPITSLESSMVYIGDFYVYMVFWLILILTIFNTTIISFYFFFSEFSGGLLGFMWYKGTGMGKYLLLMPTPTGPCGRGGSCTVWSLLSWVLEYLCF